ncbi:DUF1622 domain-containing protein [Lysobacter sp. F60174L2]|uniref:DUF1622 domain-containing protein n=1 Tax=Lysobacter sp. F60174L2 TaxID=3459295 RepID=UPI00403DBFCC
MLRQWLIAISEPAVTLVDAIAMLVILAATLRAFAGVVALVFRRDADMHVRRQLWLDYGRWLVAGLTFQLAADIIESSIVPTWEAIAQLGAVALIRTFLNYFLERDIAEVHERQQEAPTDAARPLPR